MSFLKDIEPFTSKKMNRIEDVENGLLTLRERLRNHELYTNLKEIRDVQLFMERHVFAVWDFMSLLKTLQLDLTTVHVPWTPSSSPTLSRFINEIVHGEESDINELGEPMSHYEMYIEAMYEIGAETSTINAFLQAINSGKSVADSVAIINIEDGVRSFVEYTFDIIQTDKTHMVAAAFTFGREDVIPDMFLEIIERSKLQGKEYKKLKYYLDRHIELDGDEHGPLSIEMINQLCGENDEKWSEVKEVAQESLKKRVELWDTINDLIVRSRSKTFTLF